MSAKLPMKISLDTLITGIPKLSPGVAAFFVEAGAVCFDSQGHTVGVEMAVKGNIEHSFTVEWPEVTEVMKSSWNDEEIATENGAYGVALLLIKELTDYTLVERSRKTTGFDYWLGTKDTVLFQNTARLEVSGIRCGDTSKINTRKTIKGIQINKTNTHLPGFVVIVEFGIPESHMVRHGA